MIPKIIHYCWFGDGEKTELILRCIESWKKNLPDYQIIEWNEKNFDISKCTFSKQAYENRKWAFVSDYVRLYALYNIGGFYFDTDIEVLRPLEEKMRDVKLLAGFESKDFLMTAVIGAEPKNEFIYDLLQQYQHKSFICEDGSLDMLPNPYLFTAYLTEKGLQLNGKEQHYETFSVYPQIYFNPNNLARIWGKLPKISYIVHRCDQSWRDKKTKDTTWYGKARRYLVGIGRNWIGTKELMRMKKFFKRKR